MSIYAIVLTDPDEGAWAAIREEWSDAHILLTDRIALIKAGPSTTTADISQRVGMNREKGVTGLVLDATYRSGFAESRLIEWLAKFDDE